MLLLLDTAKNTYCAVGIAEAGQLVSFQVLEKPFQQSEQLLTMIRTEVGKRAVMAIVVTQGHGDFSALRIGLSTANALAYAWGVPIRGIIVSDELTPQERLAFLAKKSKTLSFKKKKLPDIMPVYGKAPNINRQKKSK